MIAISFESFKEIKRHWLILWSGKDLLVNFFFLFTNAWKKKLKDLISGNTAKTIDISILK